MKHTLAIAALLLANVTTASAQSTMTTNCSMGRTSFSCSSVYIPRAGNPYVRDVTGGVVNGEGSARDQEWVRTCEPKIVVGSDGISRYTYKHPSCATGNPR